MCPRLKLLAILFLLARTAAPAAAGDLDGSIWEATLHTDRLGPLETHLVIEERNGALYLSSDSGALSRIRRLPAAPAEDLQLDEALFAIQLEPGSERYSGRVVAPREEGAVNLVIADERLSGTIDGGLFAGRLTGRKTSSAKRLRNYETVWDSIKAVVDSKVFDPATLQTPGWRRFEAVMTDVSKRAADDLDFVMAFRLAWANDPFSHFELRRSDVSAERMIRGFDGLRVGYQAARVEFDGAVATLTVDTMMGEDTIEQIEQAYREIAAAESKALLIDLRKNDGGAFAVKPLVEHVIDEPLYPGYFASQKWTAGNRRPPTAAELAAVEPWQGWSISAFWRSVQDTGLLRLRFDPAEPNFDGPVYVLLSKRSASATELAADALASSGEATLVGERSAGEMLSQSMFDAGEGYLVSLPIADYFSIRTGRIEGKGVPVDLETTSEAAMEAAKELAIEAVGR